MEMVYRSDAGREYTTQKAAMYDDCTHWENEFYAHTAVCRMYKQKALPSAFALWQNCKMRAKEDWQRIYPDKKGRELKLFIAQRIIDTEIEYRKALKNWRNHNLLGVRARGNWKKARRVYNAYLEVMEKQNEDFAFHNPDMC